MIRTILFMLIMAIVIGAIIWVVQYIGTPRADLAIERTKKLRRDEEKKAKKIMKKW